MMKNILVVALAFFTALCFPGGLMAQDSAPEQKKERTAASSRVNSKYDKSKNITTVRLKETTISRLVQEKDVAFNIPLHQMNLAASFTFVGKEITQPVQDVLLEFHAVSPNYLFLRGQPIIAAVNREFPGEDRALGLGTTDYKSVPPKFNSVYEEFMQIAIPADVFARLAHARSLELYVGPVAYKISKEQREYLSAISDLLLPKSPDGQTAR